MDSEDKCVKRVERNGKEPRERERERERGREMRLLRFERYLANTVDTPFTTSAHRYICMSIQFNIVRWARSMTSQPIELSRGRAVKLESEMLLPLVTFSVPSQSDLC